ncbi:carboxypeptidase-like regulatory domain-containing protein [uncultured Lutibacter sp.]|uniref:carboxypeptidase-like regulatory domain-containing protein n=1 Tax=uncultured Lutibacter sp. TaxID=437739 RepID=UPI002603FB43|nr:carboxypeptidase-like regulatory domain-containing protein [uncultured Lutibacter sp.]
MKNILPLMSLLLINFLGYSQEIKMSGQIIDSETKKPIEFVNIGILNKNLGTVSDLQGKFNFNTSKEYIKDSITISHINYQSVKIPVLAIKNQIVLLDPRTNELSEIIVTNRKKSSRKIGVKTYNPLLWLGGISKNNDIIENAQRINIPNKSVRVKFVNIYLRKGFESDSTFVRINFYKNKNDEPGDRIIFQNIIQKKKIETGWLQIDLTHDSIYLDEDFFIGVEFMPNFEKSQDVYIGAILTKGKGFSRRSSQGKWNKLQGASTINVEIEY